ncbi:hypothetical protein SpCBS45565_g04254 [Spizellomyces sp. 'palustris']|nr:hypothetical protein SpCBS45565_g04254 [Spizellomyces sp. 'palustris']
MEPDRVVQYQPIGIYGNNAPRYGGSTVRWWLPLLFLTKFLRRSILSGLGTMVTDELEGPPQSFASTVLETVGAKQPMQQLTPLKGDINVPILEQRVEEGVALEERSIQEDFANDTAEKSIQEDLANPHIETVEEEMVEEPISQIEREAPIVSSMPEAIPENELMLATQHARDDENIAVLAVNSSASTDSDPADSEGESTSVEVVALVNTTTLSPSPNPSIVVPGYDPRYQRNYDIEVLYYQPDTYLITNKPWDVRIDGDTTSCPTSESLLYAHFTEHKKLYLLHQLDYVTSGVHCWGLSKKAASVAGKCFVRRQVKKTYSALVKGHIVEDNFLIDKPLTDDPTDEKRVIVADGTEENPGKLSETRVQVLKRGYFLTYPVTHVMLSPRTGRRHQLRVHLASIGHPIIGDPAYERPHTEEAFRTMLHSWKLELPVPGDQPLRFEASEPFEILVKDEPGNWDAIPKRIPLLDPAPSPSYQKAVNSEEPGMPNMKVADADVVDAQKIVDEHLRLSYEYEAYWKDALETEAAEGESNREIVTEEVISDVAGHAAQTDAISIEVTHEVSQLDAGLDAMESTEDEQTAEAEDEAQKTVNEHLQLSYEYEAHWRRTLELDEEQQANEVGDAGPVVAPTEETGKGNSADTIPVIADVLSVVPAAGFMDTNELPSNPVEGVPGAISSVEGNQSPTEPAITASDDTSTVIPAKRTCDEVFQENVVPAKRGADDTPLTTPATPSKKVNMTQDHGELEEKTDDDLDQSQAADVPVEEDANDETPAPQVIPAEGADFVSETVAEVQPVEKALVDDDAVVSMKDTAAEGEPIPEGISAEGIDFVSQTAVEEVQIDEKPLLPEAADEQIHEGLPADHAQDNVQLSVDVIPLAELEEAVTEKQTSEVAKGDEGITAGEEVTIGEHPMEGSRVEVDPEQSPASLYMVVSEVPDLKNVIELPEESVIQSSTLESAKDAAEEGSVLVSTSGDVLGADVEPRSVENVALQDQVIEAVCEITSPARSETISEVAWTVEHTEPVTEESLKKIETDAAEKTSESVYNTDSVVEMANDLLKDAVTVPVEREVGITAPEETLGTSGQESVIEGVVKTVVAEVEGVAEETLSTAPVNAGDAEAANVHMEAEPEVFGTAVPREEPAEQPNAEVACMVPPADVSDATREPTVEEEPLGESVTEPVIYAESGLQVPEPEEQQSPIVEEAVSESVTEPGISESVLKVPEPEEQQSSTVEESVGKSVTELVVSTENISQAPEPEERHSPIVEDSDGESVTDHVVPTESVLQNAKSEEHYSPAEIVPPHQQDIQDERLEIESKREEKSVPILPPKDDIPAPKAKGSCILL